MRPLRKNTIRMKPNLIRITLLFSGLLPLVAGAQNSNAAYLSGQDSTRNPITVAVPFVGFAPDSRGSAMGDAGVATSPDAYSAHWNNAKLAFIENSMGFSLNYSPWLGNIVDDMSLNYLTFYKRIDRMQTFGASVRYFDLGEIQLRDGTGEPMGLENPREAAFDGTYSRKLSENFGVGVTGRFIWSNLSGNITGAPDAKAGTSVAIDLGVYYNKELLFNGMNSELSLGAFLSNFGQKITYSNDANQDFIPGNLKVGSAFKTFLDPYNSITIVFDANKLLVPTPPLYALDENGEFARDADNNLIVAKGKDPNRPLLSGTFGSFNDAPGGFNEEMKEITISMGTEYWYKDVFAVRMGYFLESSDKGDRKYFTAGLGFRYQVLGIDFSYLVPKEQGHPLGDTLRLSLTVNLDKEADEPLVN